VRSVRGRGPGGACSAVDAVGAGASWGQVVTVDVAGARSGGIVRGVPVVAAEKLDLTCTVGSRLTFARLERRMTQRSVSARCGVPQSQLSRVEAGGEARLWTVERLAYGVDVPAWWLAGDGPLGVAPSYRAPGRPPVMDDVLAGFAVRLRVARSIRGMSRREVADELGVNAEALRPWERGTHDLEIRFVRPLGEVLDVPVAWLLGRGKVTPWGE
jgi:transcriptional regulator with XRE-family HTH domain